MFKQNRLIILVLCVLALCVDNAFALERALLYPKSISPKLWEIVRILSNHQANHKVPYNQLSPTTDYFVRVARSEPLFKTQGTLNECARLGNRQFVFMTTPQGLYGRSLLEIYEDIGYTAKDILEGQVGEDMVAIVFRYPEGVDQVDVRDGRLADDWDKKIYVPHWDTVFALFAQLAQRNGVGPFGDGTCADGNKPYLTDAERSSVLGFSNDGLRRIKEAGYCLSGYCALKKRQGKDWDRDWEYRELLAKKLSAMEHFKGNGVTHNEMLDPCVLKPKEGLKEFLGPNMRLTDLPEFAVIHLGKLTMEETYKVGGR
ncbi:MAG: hypothetical protein V2B18_00845 [Pseudomonadota bacterium]